MAVGDFENNDPPTYRHLAILLGLSIAFHALRVLGRNVLLSVASAVNALWTRIAISSALAKAHVDASNTSDDSTDPDDLRFGLWSQLRRSTKPLPSDIAFNSAGRAYGRLYKTYKAALANFQKNKNVFLSVTVGLDLFTVTLFVYSAAVEKVRRWVAISQFTLGLVFALGNSLSIAFDRGQMTLSEFLVDSGVIFTSLCVPSLLASGLGAVSYINFNYFRAWSLYRSIARIYYPSGNNPLSLAPSEVGTFRPYAIILTVNIIVVIFLCAMTVYTLEHVGAITPGTAMVVTEDGLVWNVVTANYFMVVTMTTVGYGDFLPSNGLSKLLVFVILATAVFYVGSKLGGIIQLYSTVRLGDGEYHQSHEIHPHVIVIGEFEYSALDLFIDAFLSDPANTSSRVVILAPKLRFGVTEFYQILSGPDRHRQIFFIKGSPFNQADRRRAKFRYASAIFVLSARETVDAVGNDSQNALSISAIREQLPKTPILSIHLLPESQSNVEDAVFFRSNEETLPGGPATDDDECDIDSEESQDQGILMRFVERYLNPDTLSARFGRLKFEHFVYNRMGLAVPVTPMHANKAKGETLCLKELLMALLATNTRCPGASTLIGNVVFELSLRYHENDQPWKNEYKLGASNDFYLWNLPPEAEGLTFADLAVTLFHSTGALLISMVAGGVHEENDIASMNAVATLSSKAVVLASLELSENSSSHLARFTRQLRKRKESIEGREVPLDPVQASSTASILELRYHRRRASTIDWVSTATSADGAVQRQISMSPGFSNHIVICAFDTAVVDDVDVYLRYLIESPFGLDSGSQPPVVVFLGPELSSSDSLNIRTRYPSFVAVAGDPVMVEDLQSVYVAQARAVIVLPEVTNGLTVDEENEVFSAQDFENADARTFFVSLHLELLLGKRARTRMILFLKDMRSISFCPRPRTRLTHQRLGEPATTEELERTSSERSNAVAGASSGLQTVDGEEPSEATSSWGDASMFDLNIEDETPEGDAEEDGNDMSVFRNIDDTASFARMRYASGQIVIPSLGPALLCREHQIPGILGIVQGLIGYHRGSTPLLRQFTVPEVFDNRPYGQLFRKVTELGGLPMGLYRCGRAPVLFDPFDERDETATVPDRRDDSETSVVGRRPHNSLPWVFTNPPQDTVVSSSDGVFVVAQDFGAMKAYFKGMYR